MANNNRNNKNRNNHNNNNNRNNNKNRNNRNQNNYNNNRNNNRRNNRNRKKDGYWRDSYDYRRAYLEKNPGICGKVFICGYCGKPIWGAENMQVDHVIPPSRFSKKTYRQGELLSDTSWQARLLNTSFNLVASCPECNRKKSNQITPLYVTKGFGSKIVQTGIHSAASLTSAAVLLGGYGVTKAASFGVKAAKRPFQKDVPRELTFLYVVVIVILLLAFVLFH